jgi:hypothetical protein
MSVLLRFVVLAAFCLALGVGCNKSPETTGGSGTVPSFGGPGDKSPEKDKKKHPQAPPFP